MAWETALVRKTRQLGKSVSHLLLYLLPITTFHLVVMKYFYAIICICAPLFWHDIWKHKLTLVFSYETHYGCVWQLL